MTISLYDPISLYSLAIDWKHQREPGAGHKEPCEQEEEEVVVVFSRENRGGSRSFRDRRLQRRKTRKHKTRTEVPDRLKGSLC